MTIPILGTNIAERIAGYRRTLREHGIYDLDLIREVDFVGESAFDQALDLLTRTDVDAIFTTSQSTAMGVYRAIKQVGRRLPEDVALFGYDDVPWMELVDIPVSTVHQPVDEIARLATELLVDCIETNCKLPGEVHTVPSSIVLRQSCGCAPRA